MGKETDVVFPNLDIAFDLANLVIDAFAFLIEFAAAAFLNTPSSPVTMSHTDGSPARLRTALMIISGELPAGSPIDTTVYFCMAGL